MSKNKKIDSAINMLSVVAVFVFVAVVIGVTVFVSQSDFESRSELADEPSSESLDGRRDWSKSQLHLSGVESKPLQSNTKLDLFENKADGEMAEIKFYEPDD